MSEPPSDGQSPEGSPAGRGRETEGRQLLPAGQLLDESARVLVRGWPVLPAAVAVADVIGLLVIVVALLAPLTGPFQGFMTAGVVVPLLIAAAAAHVTSAQRRRRPVTTSGTLRVAVARLPTLLAAHVLPAAVAWALATAIDGGWRLADSGLNSSSGGAAAVAGIAVAAAAVLAVPAVLVLFAVVVPAVVVERRGPVAAMRRSTTLVWRRYFPALGRVLLAVAMFGPLAGFALEFLLVSPVGAILGSSAAVVVTLVLQIIGAPLIPIALTLVYLEVCPGLDQGP